MNISLQERTADHVRIYFEKAQDPQIKAFLPQKAKTVDEALEDFVQASAPGSSSYGRTIYADGVYVGDIWCYGIHEDDEPDAMVSFCIFEKKRWNCGIATEALKIFLSDIARRFGVRTVGAFVYADNKASLRVLEKNGFVIAETFEEEGALSCYCQLMLKKYYEAYDDRYLQIHKMNLQWSDSEPSPIVWDTIEKLSVTKENKLLELGCGEGRDAFALLRQGCNLLATDIAPEAIRYCRVKMPNSANHFQVLDCVAGELDGQFDFIYAVAVVHMLVEDSDRNAFYSFIRNHLTTEGKALICTMGDGKIERSSDISTAFTLQDRIHQQTGTPVKIAGTSCRMVSFNTFTEEIKRNALKILEQGITTTVPGFSEMMYALVCRDDK